MRQSKQRKGTKFNLSITIGRPRKLLRKTKTFADAETSLESEMENLADDPDFISAIVQEVKSQGLFDNFRKECLADVDTKPAYQNLRQRVESTVSKFLAQQTWTDNIRHKNQLRERLRKHVIE